MHRCSSILACKFGQLHSLLPNTSIELYIQGRSQRTFCWRSNGHLLCEVYQEYCCRWHCWSSISVLRLLTWFWYTRLGNDALSAGKAGSQRQFRGMIDVYVKTIRADGVRGLYRGFVISCVGIFVYRGLYFGLYDSLKPIVLDENTGLVVNFILAYGKSQFCPGFLHFESCWY